MRLLIGELLSAWPLPLEIMRWDRLAGEQAASWVWSKLRGR